MTSSPGSIIRMEDTLKAILPEGKFSGPPPPVEAWNPACSADIGMEIRADGRWWHDGGEIKRERLVKLFSRILRRDADGTTWLVTPYEKVIVHVADAPFLAVRVDRDGPPGPSQQLTFNTSLGDVTIAGPAAPIRVETDPETGEPSPYVLVRGRLEAKITRSVFYELVDLAEPDPDGRGLLGVWSQGQFFALGPAA
ncbi:DUF1285 domain-containing protein [Hyphomonas sp.]|uniref:DUF1285 domain-containing protein n=1 Tax=Hyphomonas sp. TaxID=87 RepID=UPI00391B55E1